MSTANNPTKTQTTEKPLSYRNAMIVAEWDLPTGGLDYKPVGLAGSADEALEIAGSNLRLYLASRYGLRADQKPTRYVVFADNSDGDTIKQILLVTATDTFFSPIRRLQPKA